MKKQLGSQTIKFLDPPSIAAYASVVGKREGDGPLGNWFDRVSSDARFGEKTWEKAESAMLRQCYDLCVQKFGGTPDMIFSGDLLNQCISSAFALKHSAARHFGIYGACSTMGEALILGAMALDGGFAETVCCATGSHFCSSERQYRFPLEYGGQRTPTSQWTVTGAGAAMLTRGEGVRITLATPGKIVDMGVTDANNMGSAMAPAAYETLRSHFADSGRTPEDYDLIVTGDLGAVGRDTLEDLFLREGLRLGERLTDCGCMIFNRKAQRVGSGGSGCGCSASVLCSYLLRGLDDGRWNKILFAPTGALLSPTSTMQGDSIPAVCHAVALER